MKFLHRQRQEQPSAPEPTSEQVLVDHLPIDGRTGQPMTPMAQPGYYPGFHVLDQQRFWDQATRDTILKRVHEVPPIRFFSPEEARLMQAVCDRILPQDDRDDEHKIPLLNFIDDRLYHGRGDGYQFEDMPSDADAHRLGLQAIEAIAQRIYGRPFIELGVRAQDHVLQTIHDGKPPAGEEIWHKMSVERFWQLLVQDVVRVYYAHPYAWDEVGFGGPAYPRGYMRLEGGQPEPWEVDEQRYTWQAPAASLSDVAIYPEAEFKKHPPGQGGTH